jgi:hypothetical protein
MLHIVRDIGRKAKLTLLVGSKLIPNIWQLLMEPWGAILTCYLSRSAVKEMCAFWGKTIRKWAASYSAQELHRETANTPTNAPADLLARACLRDG